MATLPALALAASCAMADPTPTATPAAPRLSGGFGRPQSTPAATNIPGPRKGQSLADVVRAASESRQAVETPKPGVAITNRTLVTDPSRGRLTTWQATPRPTGSPAVAAGAKATASAQPQAAAPTPEPDQAQEEATWHELARSLRQKVADLKERVALLDAEAKKLENDFYAWDDGQYRDNVIKPAWDKKREELVTARRDLEEAERDLADLPEKARKAGALPGWIRE
jgi:hypothetical protein